jgi:hypothetical protein
MGVGGERVGGDGVEPWHQGFVRQAHTGAMPERPPVPSPRQLARATGVVAIVALLLGVALLLRDRTFALEAYTGAIFMLQAASRLSLRQQLLLALCLAVFAGTGDLSLRTVLFVLVAMAALTQAVFNRWSLAAAATLPVVVATRNLEGGGAPLLAAAGTLLGALLTIALVRIVRAKAPPTPAPAPALVPHAGLLAVGCVAIVALNRLVGLGRINWALAALCLSFLPVLGERSANIAWRMLGTLVGAVLATILAVALPDNVDLALAGVAAVLTVAYALMPEPSARVPYFTFLTTTVLLLYGAGKFGPVAHLAVVRVLMTVIGVGLAAVLSLVLVRLVPRPPAPASQTPPG